MDFSFSDLNFNSVETLTGFEASTAFGLSVTSLCMELTIVLPFARHYSVI